MHTTVKFSQVRELLRQGILRAFGRMAEHLSSPPTTVGISFSGHQGVIKISANTDDDQSFLAETTGEFTHGSFATILIPGVQEWEALDAPGVVNREDGTDFSGNFEEACGELFKFVVTATKDCLLELSDSHKLPHRVLFEALAVLGTGDVWVCPGGCPLPPRPRVASEPLSVLSFDGPEPKGLKVYRLGRAERKYCDLYFPRYEYPKLDGRPVSDKWPKECAVETFTSGNCRRKGDFASCSLLNGALALNSSSVNYNNLVEYFSPFSEFLPVYDEDGNRWDLVHVLRVEDLLDSKPHHFRFWSFDHSMPSEILRHEFNVDRLRALPCSWFKLSALPSSGPFFICGDDSHGFIDTCRQMGVRGSSVELVWCENTAFLARHLEEFRKLVDLRLTRIMGSTSVKPVNIECLDRQQIRLWTRAKQLTDHTDLKGREGSLCQSLPGALRSIKYMEQTGDGLLAIYGPSV